MNERMCTYKGCERQKLAKGLCRLHYQQTNFNPTKSSWGAMKRRCYDKNFNYYEKYGGRGISVCERWMDFTNFLEDMGERPEGMSLDRIDVNSDYTPENCRWANREQQNHNQTTRKDNTSGVPGVNWHTRTKRWVARIQIKGNRIILGNFKELEDAKRAVAKAKNELKKELGIFV